jgi:PAS domain S-box-containing protein
LSHQAIDLERSLREARERENAYRDWLAETAERTRRLRTHTTALLETLGKCPPKQRDLMRTLRDTAQISSRALNVGRTSLWLFDAAGERLECKLLLAAQHDAGTLNSILPTSACPEYFRALGGSGVVAVEDVAEDPRTRGLEPYLRMHGVTALLDISIAIPGELMGVVCHEHIGGRRIWHPEEIDFASHVSNLIALALEVERRQLAEAKAVSVEARYRYLVESLPVTVYSFDPFSQKIEYLSPQFRELGSIDTDAMLARGLPAWIEAIHEDDRPAVQARFAPHGVDRSPTEIEYRVVLPSGEARYVRDQCRVVRNHSGDPVAIQGVLADITEQRKSQERAAEFERRLRTLLEHADLLAMILDEDGAFEFVNACFERLTGRDASELRGRDSFAVLVPESEADATRERYRRDVRSGITAARFENEILDRNGERRRILWTTVLLRADHGSPAGSCSLGLDITDRVQHDVELLQQTKLESLGQLSAGVAHDFNNLLMVMSGQVEFMRRAPPGSSTQEELSILQQSLRQAADLTKSLLVYARREPVAPLPLEVDSLIEELTPLLTSFAGGAVQLVTSLNAPNVKVSVDPMQLRQVIMNLTTNAVEATRGHGGEVRLATALEFVPRSPTGERANSDAGRYVTLSVSDDGRGMDARTLARVFEPFFTTKANGRGTGLGLAMTQANVERAGGFMRAESKPGEGSLFRAYLPVVSAGELAFEERQSRTMVPDQTSRILIVEDEPLVRRLLATVLEELVSHVQAVGTVRDATRIASSERIDLLVTDGTLPDGSGRTLARSARAARPQMRVLLVSGAPEDEEEFDATLHKPFTRERLLATVRELLEIDTRGP